MLPLPSFATAEDLQVAPRSRFAQVRQLREILTSHYQQVELFNNFQRVYFLALDVFPLGLERVVEADPEDIRLVAKNNSSLLVEQQHGGRQVQVLRVNGIKFYYSFFTDICKGANN